MTVSGEVCTTGGNWILQSQTRWMDAGQATLSPWLVALIEGLVRGGRHVTFYRQQEGRTSTLGSRTRTGWPTAKAPGMFRDKERPLTLTAECCIYLNHNSGLLWQQGSSVWDFKLLLRLFLCVLLKIACLAVSHQLNYRFEWKPFHSMHLFTTALI